MALPIAALVIALAPAQPAPAAPSETARFLASTGSFAVLTRTFDPEDWMPRSMVAEMSLQYQDLIREHDARAAYQVATLDERFRQHEGRRAFARYIVLRLGTRKAWQELRRLDRRNGGRLAQAQRSYNGIMRKARKPIRFNAMLQGFQYGASVNYLELKSKVWVHSVLANGEVEYQVERRPLLSDLRPELEAFPTGERWMFKLWRPIPVLRDTEARVTYGTTTATLRFSVLRYFTRHLRSAYELSSNEHRLTVQYAVRI